MTKKVKCPVCTSNATQYSDSDFEFFVCPVCGRFELEWPISGLNMNRNHLASYLAYHCYQNDVAKGMIDYRYNTVRDKSFCDKYSQEFENGYNTCGRPVHMDSEMVENWYPKTFAERIDNILLYLASHAQHIGQWITLNEPATMSVLFIDRQEKDEDIKSQTRGQWVQRDPDEYHEEAKYILNFLKGQNYLQDYYYNESNLILQLSPKGYARVDELQKNTANGRQALVAMKFGDDTIPLREAIRKGVADAGYIAIFIDEVQHNDFITPELLKHIKDSKFVVADLTHQNNGAYFEEGYAMGLGKPVIQLCKKDVQLHFDIAQKNTIIWKAEDEIPERLTNRIKATIE